MDMSEPRADDDLPEMFRMMVSRSELAEAVRAFLAKHDVIQERLIAQQVYLDVHGVHWPTGDEYCWMNEIEALREAVK